MRDRAKVAEVWSCEERKGRGESGEQLFICANEQCINRENVRVVAEEVRRMTIEPRDCLIRLQERHRTFASHTDAGQ